MQETAEALKGRLNERQKRFADYYLETGNARKAAEMAGYNSDYGSAVKRQPAVQAYLRERLSVLDSARVASLSEVLEYLTQVLRGEEDEDGKGATARMKAAEMLGKRMGMFAEAGAGQLPPAVIVDDIANASGEAE